MAIDILTDLAFENFHKAVVLPDERHRLTENCRFFGDRICIFCEQIKKNNYITLPKSKLEKIIKVMETFTVVEGTEEK
ncbi:hypothetical protein [Streptococcus oralis]|uniref:hypothetical protein n=1 Tax=Streptococcus oralis TaxID=1303 RepID=UPI002284101D|nr:hypothetical protein [Streptococcus oralis]MCY7099048.1 hypothetical protein [Streptococcus oralis]